MKKILSIFAATLATSFVTAAQADENKFQTHLELGAAVPLGSPMTNVFSPGPSAQLNWLWSVHPNISIGPGLNGFYLPKTVTTRSTTEHDSATFWQLGPVVRFQGDRAGKAWPVAKVSPWLDVSGMVGATGNLVRPAVNVGVGAEGPLDEHHVFWLGPFARYTHAFSVENDLRDSNVLQLGVSFSFDSPIKLPTVKYTKTVTNVVHDVKVVKEVVPATTPPTPSLDFSEKVYFDANSSKLRWESRDKLDAVVAKLNSSPTTKIKVEGNASADGPLSWNNKLSAARTKVVVDYLVKHGVDPKRLTPESEGITHPSVSNKTLEGRERNRRVEFTVLFYVTK